MRSHPIRIRRGTKKQLIFVSTAQLDTQQAESCDTHCSVYMILQSMSFLFYQFHSTSFGSVQTCLALSRAFC